MASFADHGVRGGDQSLEIGALRMIIAERDATITQLKQQHRHDTKTSDHAWHQALEAKGYRNLADVSSRADVQRAIDREKSRTERLRAADDAEMDFLADTSKKDAIIEKLRQDAEDTAMAYQSLQEKGYRNIVDVPNREVARNRIAKLKGKIEELRAEHLDEVEELQRLLQERDETITLNKKRYRRAFFHFDRARRGRARNVSVDSDGAEAEG
jgi:uncharacterized protein (UPF0297 family)